MVKKNTLGGVIWVPSSNHPVVHLAHLKGPMQRPSIKKSVTYSTHTYLPTLVKYLTECKYKRLIIYQVRALNKNAAICKFPIHELAKSV